MQFQQRNQFKGKLQSKDNKFQKNKQFQQKNKMQKNFNKKEAFFTTKQTKKFPNQRQNSFKPTSANSLELCKFFLTGNCHRGKDCDFSHNTSDFPCKYLHSTGSCEKGNQCRFSHKILQNMDQITKFMEDNEDFLNELQQKKGKTNLGEYFLKFRSDKADKERQAKLPQNVMVPPQLLGKPDQFMPIPQNSMPIQKQNDLSLNQQNSNNSILQQIQNLININNQNLQQNIFLGNQNQQQFNPLINQNITAQPNQSDLTSSIPNISSLFSQNTNSTQNILQMLLSQNQKNPQMPNQFSNTIPSQNSQQSIIQILN